MIFGGDQRVDNKSHDYTVLRLDRGSSQEWHTLTPSSHEESQESGDLAFEHKKTGSIISINSVCQEHGDATLEELSRNLLMGLNTQGKIKTTEINIAGVAALESTLNAGMSPKNSNNESNIFPVKVRAVVLRKNGCTFDLMYIARPHFFNEILPNFDRFLRGFSAN